jgi:hypothetical protein
MVGGPFPGPIFPDPIFPDPIFPGSGGGGGGEVPPVQVGSYRYSLPAPIQRKQPSDLYTLAKIHEAMED